MRKRCWTADYCGGFCALVEEHLELSHHRLPFAEECHRPKPSSSISTSRFKKTFGVKTKNELRFCCWNVSYHIVTYMLGWRAKNGHWTGVWRCFKLLRHQLEGIYCLRQLSLLWGQSDRAVAASRGVLIWHLNPLFLFPHSLTTSPSSNTTWHSKGLTEPSATPLS